MPHSSRENTLTRQKRGLAQLHIALSRLFFRKSVDKKKIDCLTTTNLFTNLKSKYHENDAKVETNFFFQK